MYTDINFKTKKALKEALASGKEVRIWQPNGDLTGTGVHVPTDGIVYLEGPHYPAPHTWYARATMNNGLITKVS